MAKKKPAKDDDKDCTFGTVDDVVKVEGSDDMMRGLRWVFEHLSRVSLEADDGSRRMNRKLLVEAPNAYAKSFLVYAFEAPDRFVEKFGPRLMPKEETPEAKTDAEVERLTDPSLGSLREYLIVMEAAEIDVDPSVNEWER